MNAPFKLQALLDLAQNQADVSARTLGLAVAREQSEEQKLQMLIGYRRDYQLRFEATTAGSLAPVAWANYHAFMKKLDMAVDQQREIVAQWRRKMVASQGEWKAKQREVKSYDTLSRRHHQAEVLRESRREQREMDDFATKTYRGDDQ